MSTSQSNSCEPQGRGSDKQTYRKFMEVYKRIDIMSFLHYLHNAVPVYRLVVDVCSLHSLVCTLSLVKRRDVC